MANMDSYSKKRTDVKGELSSGITDIKEKSDEFKEVKDSLQGMPDGLDSDLLSMISDIETSGKADAKKDIESVKAAIIDQAKKTAENIKSEVSNKLSDNESAINKLDGISSKYGKDAKDKAKTAISDNSKKGEEIISDLDSSIEKVENDIQSILKDI